MTTYTTSTGILTAYREHSERELCSADIHVIHVLDLTERLYRAAPHNSPISREIAYLGETDEQRHYEWLYDNLHGLAGLSPELDRLTLPDGSELAPRITLITAPRYYRPSPGAELRIASHYLYRAPKYPGQPDADRYDREFFSLADGGDLDRYLRRTFTD